MRKWNQEEIQKAISELKNGKDYKTIGVKLKRSVNSIKLKLNKLGFYVIKDNVNIENKCLNCNTLFIGKKHRKFCSKSCSSTYNNIKNSKIIKNKNKEELTILEIKKIIKEYLERKTTIDKILKNNNISSKILYKILKNNNIKTGTIKKKKKPKRNIIGNKYNYLTVLSISEDKFSDNSYLYDCKCDCGNMTTSTSYRLIYNMKKTCGMDDCLYYRQDINNYGYLNKNFKGYKEISGQLYSSIRLGAKRRNIEFNVSIKYLWELFITQNRKCNLSNIELKFGKTNKDERTASLDRIDSQMGYIKKNLQWVHKDINKMKLNYDNDYFIEICKLISKSNN